ncbi:LptF/LptG family permease [Nibricoccus sp. IMCC34717]|uniref:LptF/LptG family permease n=1 Tax=Nibricoccus sp. IMCC34717 TaxID=3034021 RepID=UPI00384E3F0C
MISVLRRHLLSATLVSVGGAIAFFAFVMATVNMLRDLLTYFLDGRLPATLFLKLSGLLFPFVFTYALPMGMLLGVLLVLGRLSADNEITAMRAAGWSVARICAPLYALAVAGALLALYINFDLMPRARVSYHKDFDQTLRSTALDFIKPRTFVRNLIPNKILYVGEKESGVLRNFWLWEFDNQGRVVRTWHADEARPVFNAEEATVELELANARFENRDAKNPESVNQPPLTATFHDTRLKFSLESALGKAKVRRKLDWMTWDQLWEERRRLKAEKAPRTQILKVDLTFHQKITSAIAVLAFTVLAIPLGIRAQRKETSANLGIAVSLVLSYYVLTVAVGWLDRIPKARPDLLLWVPVFIFLGLGLFLMRRVDRV